MKKRIINSDNITKKDLDSALEKFYYRLVNDVDGKLNNFKIEIKEEFREHRDHSDTRFDDVMGQLETLRDENTIGTHQTGKLRESVDDHEKRIKILEKSQSTP